MLHLPRGEAAAQLAERNGEFQTPAPCDWIDDAVERHPSLQSSARWCHDDDARLGVHRVSPKPLDLDVVLEVDANEDVEVRASSIRAPHQELSGVPCSAADLGDVVVSVGLNLCQSVMKSSMET